MMQNGHPFVATVVTHRDVGYGVMVISPDLITRGIAYSKTNYAPFENHSPKVGEVYHLVDE